MPQVTLTPNSRGKSLVLGEQAAYKRGTLEVVANGTPFRTDDEPYDSERVVADLLALVQLAGGGWKGGPDPVS